MRLLLVLLAWATFQKHEADATPYRRIIIPQAAYPKPIKAATPPTSLLFLNSAVAKQVQDAINAHVAPAKTTAPPSPPASAKTTAPPSPPAPAKTTAPPSPPAPAKTTAPPSPPTPAKTTAPPSPPAPAKTTAPPAPPAAAKTTAPPPLPIPALCVCPPSFLPLGEDECYHLVADGTFESVQVACQSLGGRLTVVTGPQQDSQARRLMSKHWRAMTWIGLRDESKGGDPQWRWSDGTALNYSDWRQAPGRGRCVVSWVHGGWQRRDCRLTAPGLCHVALTVPQPCDPPPAVQPPGLTPTALSGEEDKWKLLPPPAEVPLPPLRWLPTWISQRFVLRDAPAQWHQWL